MGPTELALRPGVDPQGYFRARRPDGQWIVGAGRMSGRGEVTAAGLARVELAIPSAYAGLFGQYALVPSFQNRTLQVLLWGLNLSLNR